MTHEVRLAHRIEYGFVHLAGALACALPPGASRRLGRTLGTVARLLGVRTAVARANLARAFPERGAPERERILAAAYEQAGMTALEILRFRKLDPAELDRIAATTVGLEHVAAARARGKGVVLLTGHYGAFDLAGATVARHGHPVHFFVRGQSNPLVDAELQGRRAQLGAGVVPHGIGVRGALRALRMNACVALVADQDAGRRGIFVDFFGTPASTPPGPAELCVRTGAPLVLGYLVRRGDGSYEGHMLPPIDPPASGDDAADVRVLTQLHATALESWIRERPEQWLWTHRRWKTRPPAGMAHAPTPALAALALALALAAVMPGAFRSQLARSAALDSTGVPGRDSASRDRGADLPQAESAFDGAGSSVFPLSEARVRRVFEDVRIRRTETGWAIDAEEIFQAGVAPARAAMGLPDYRASVGPDSASRGLSGTVRGLSVTVDGLPMGVTALPGSAAPGQDLGGIERLYRWEVPFSAEEIRTVRLSYSIGDSRTDRGEPLLFFYLNPGSLWEGEAAKVTASVDLGAVDREDLIPAWLRPAGYRVYGSQVIWRRSAGDAVADIALAYRPAVADPLAAFADRKVGPLALTAEATEEWFERLSVRETRYWAGFLRARRGASVDTAGATAALAREPWYRAARGYRDSRLAKNERMLLARLEERLLAWRRAQVPTDSLTGGNSAP